MKKILFITTQYRVGERIYPIIPFLSKMYKIDLLRLYQMNPKRSWPGNCDIRSKFKNTYLKFFDNEIKKIQKIDYDKYNLIICDDDRARNGVDTIYKNKKSLMVGCSHGNRDLDPSKWHAIKHYRKSFDKCFVFGNKELLPYSIPSGIPSNDILKKYLDVEKKHILIICNFLGNRSCPFPIKFNKYFFRECGVKELQKKHNKKVLIKLKSREDEKGYKHNIKYLESILPRELDYKIIIDVKDDNLLIAQSCLVISAPSTLTFKPIQLNIPTVVIKNSGQNGLFSDFDGLLDLKKKDILKYFSSKHDYKDFLKNTLSGGLNFNSTELYLENIKNLINER